VTLPAGVATAVNDHLCGTFPALRERSCSAWVLTGSSSASTRPRPAARGTPSRLLSWPCRFDPGHPLHVNGRSDPPVRHTGGVLVDHLKADFDPSGPLFSDGSVMNRPWIGHAGYAHTARSQPSFAAFGARPVTTTGPAVSSKLCRAAMTSTAVSPTTPGRAPSNRDDERRATESVRHSAACRHDFSGPTS
jgi:hypothetical protein